jgi:hypothetical protein
LFHLNNSFTRKVRKSLTKITNPIHSALTLNLDPMDRFWNITNCSTLPNPNSKVLTRNLSNTKVLLNSTNRSLSDLEVFTLSRKLYTTSPSLLTKGQQYE